MSVCPIHRRDRIISSLRNFLYPSFHSPILAFIVWSLLCGVLFHLNCDLFWVKFFISIFKSVHGVLKLLSMGIFQAVMDAESFCYLGIMLDGSTILCFHFWNCLYKYGYDWGGYF